MVEGRRCLLGAAALHNYANAGNTIKTQAQISAGRQLYKGPMKVDGISEYNTRMKRAWSDTFKNTGIDIDKYLDSIT